MFLKASVGWRKAVVALHRGNLRSDKRGWRYNGGKGDNKAVDHCSVNSR